MGQLEERGQKEVTARLRAGAENARYQRAQDPAATDDV